jgi:hypothetical protein
MSEMTSKAVFWFNAIHECVAWPWRFESDPQSAIFPVRQMVFPRILVISPFWVSIGIDIVVTGGTNHQLHTRC